MYPASVSPLLIAGRGLAAGRPPDRIHRIHRSWGA